MRKSSCLLVFVLVGVVGAWAQEVKSLPVLIEEIYKTVQTSSSRMQSDLSRMWKAGFINSLEKDDLNAVFAEVNNLHLPPNPDYTNFVETILAFSRSKDKNSYLVWLEGVKKALKETSRQRMAVQSYLKETSAIATAGLMHTGGTYKWFVRGAQTWVGGTDIRVKVQEGSVVCTTGKDSINIFNTDITHVIGDKSLTGSKGRVNWVTTKDMYAELNNYRINFANSDYTADSVLFYFPKKHEQPLRGELRDKPSLLPRKGDAGFPKFQSHRIDLPIAAIFNGIDFKGGISYEGEKLVGFGRGRTPAQVHISPADSLNLYVFSNYFTIDNDKVLAGTSSISFPLGGVDAEADGITHPNVSFSYTKQNNTVAVRRSSDQSSRTPFRDDYHQTLLGVEELLWPLEDKFVNMRTVTKRALMESANFFNENMYDDMQGIDEVHPLNSLYNASNEWKKTTFTIPDYAARVRKPMSQLRQQMILLSYSDFVDYDEQTDEVTVKQRLFDYVLARVAKRDYDAIKFASFPNTRNNAKLDLKSRELQIYGVDNLTLSAAQSVYAFPVDKTIHLYRNRDLSFNGKLMAGMFDFVGTNMFFSYDKYEIKLTEVDSMVAYVADKLTKKRGAQVKTPIRSVSGTLWIDMPDNKSGKKVNPGYPMLKSDKESFVYFENIRHGEYRKEKFWMTLLPFTILNMNDGDGAQYRFQGILTSNIIPDVRDSLILMKDLSFGMKFSTPPTGSPLYGRGTITSDMVLDMEGFIGKGDVKLNNSFFTSNEIVLMPDSMTSVTKTFTVNPIANKRPDAVGENIAIQYVCADLVINARTQTKAFDVYKKRVKHVGQLMVYDDLLDARGTMDLKDVRMSSSLFNLHAVNILSDHANVEIAAFAKNDVRINTRDMKVDLNLETNKGMFTNNTDDNEAFFPANKFKSAFKRFAWYMADGYLNIGIEDKDEGKKLWKLEDEEQLPEFGKNVFTATEHSMDGLRFVAPMAKYDLTKGDITCSWVNHIDLANGRFYPSDGEVYISNFGIIRQLNGGKLLLDREDSTRTLAKVDMNIRGRLTFNGSGDYTYVNQDKLKIPIRFTSIGADTARLIYASINFTVEDDFKLNKGFIYKGEMRLQSRHPDMYFNGFVRMTSDSLYLKHSWLKTRTHLVASDIRIPVEVENRGDMDNNRIFNGIMVYGDRAVKPYAALTSARLFHDDRIVFGARGELVWNEKAKVYTITDTAVHPRYGLTYTPKKEDVQGFGKLATELPINGIRQSMVGGISYDIKEEVLKLFDVLYRLDFALLPSMDNILAQDFVSQEVNVLEQDTSLQAKLALVYGTDYYSTKEGTANVTVPTHIPDSLGGLFALDALSMKWDAKASSYTADSKVKVLTARKKVVDAPFDIKMELIPRRTNSQLFIYLGNADVWYYFEYANKVLFTLSSNDTYNEALKLEKPDKKEVRDMNKELLYTITLCPTSKKDRFLKRIKTGAAQEATPEEKKEEAEATQEVVPATETPPETPAETKEEAKEEEVKEDAP